MMQYLPYKMSLWGLLREGGRERVSPKTQLIISCPTTALTQAQVPTVGNVIMRFADVLL